jgi:hypothetical protein
LKAAFRARKRGRFERLFTVFFLCNGSAIKGRGVSFVSSNAYSLKAAVTIGSGLIKGERSEPTRGKTQETRREKKSRLIVPLFLLKETEEATEKGHEQRRKKATSRPASITSSFPCFQRGSNTENKNINTQRHRDRKQEINTEETEQRDPNTERK